MKYLSLYLVAVLLLCLAPMPYGYYTLVRVLATVVFGIYAYKCFAAKKEGLTLVFATLALLFQPFAKVGFNRVVWNVIDVIVAIGMVALFFWERKNREKAEQGNNPIPSNNSLKVDMVEDIHPDDRLSRLVITKDFRLLLPDYNHMEIKIEPLAKAVYLLFLNHPEGIIFKDLPSYRNELAEIYRKLRPGGLTDRALQSIEDVTNPLLNSINEKCARIRGAFVGQFDDHIARHYYIDGRRGEAKKISLPRDLVIWE